MDNFNPYESALAAIPGSLLPETRREAAKEAVRRYRAREDETGLGEYMRAFTAESEEDFQGRYGDFLAESEGAFLTDISYAIAIAKPAGAMAARRREKERAAAGLESGSDALERREAPRVRVCPENHPHGRTGTCYTGHSCRCDDCRTSNSARKKQWLLNQGATRTSQPKMRADWRPQLLAEDSPKHGTRGGYANYGCRCDRCTEASRVYIAERRKNPGGTRNKISEHGTTGRYVRGCRCALCSDAMAEDHRQRKNKKQS
jgi:hypothetical protein